MQLTSVGNWDTTQMGANTNDNHPLWVWATVSISFLMTERTNIDAIFTGNIFWGTMSNKDWFTSPFEKTSFT